MHKPLSQCLKSIGYPRLIDPEKLPLLFLLYLDGLLDEMQQYRGKQPGMELRWSQISARLIPVIMMRLSFLL